MSALSICKELETSIEGFLRKLELAEKSFKGTLQLLSMHGQFFRDITEHRMAEVVKWNIWWNKATT